MTAPHETAPRKAGGVSLARPLVYLGVAAVIGLGSLLLPSAGSAPTAPAPAATAPTNAPGAACSDVKESLRPEGPLPPPGDPDRHPPRRWVVEVAHSWFNRFRRLRTRGEKQASHYLGFVQLAAVLIIYRKVRHARSLSG